MSPINPQIALSGQMPQMQDPLEAYSKVMSLKNLMGQQQANQQSIEMNQMKLDQMKRQFQAEETAKEVLSKHNGDIQKALPELVSVLGPDALPLVEQVAKAEKEKNALAGQQLTQYQQGVKYLTDSMDQIFSMPPPARENAYQIARRGLPPEIQAQMPPAWDDELFSGYNNKLKRELEELSLREKRAAAQKSEQEASGTQPITPYQQAQLDAQNKPKPGVDVPYSPDVLEQQKELRAAGRSPGMTGFTTPQDIEDVAQGIYDGTLNPVMSTRSLRERTAIEARLKRKGYNAAIAEQDYKAINKHLSTLNGAQQERLRQAVTFTYDSLDVIENLYKEWKKEAPTFGMKVFNKAALATAKQLPGKAGAAATALEAQINDLTAELGTVYKGGNSSTDESLKLAAANLKADWNEETFKKAMGLIRTNLRIRKNSILNSEAVGVSPGSPYLPPTGTTAKPKSDPLGIF